MADMAFSLQSPIEFQRAQLMHTASDCTVPPTIPSFLTFDESSLGVTCTNKPWSRQPLKWSAADATTGLFHEPNIATLPTTIAPPPVIVDDGSPCKVFLPGVYDSANAPVIGSANYFMSGDYGDSPGDPLYAFGHGLSYSRFKYAALEISPDSPAADAVVEIALEQFQNLERPI